MRPGPGAGWDGSRTIPTGRVEAIGHFERALRLSPLDPMNFNNHVGLASAYQLLEDFDKSVSLFQRALQERRTPNGSIGISAPALAGAGRIQEAQVAFEEMLRSYPDYTVTKYKEAMVFSPAALERMAVYLRKLGLPEGNPAAP